MTYEQKLNDQRSLDRPAWSIKDGFNAYKHKQRQSNPGNPDPRPDIIENYYVETKGEE